MKETNQDLLNSILQVVSSEEGQVDEMRDTKTHEQDKKNAHMLKDMLNDFDFEMKDLEANIRLLNKIKSKVYSKLDKVVINRIPDSELRDMGSLVDSINNRVKDLSRQLGQIQRKNPKFKDPRYRNR